MSDEPVLPFNPGALPDEPAPTTTTTDNRFAGETVAPPPSPLPPSAADIAWAQQNLGLAQDVLKTDVTSVGSDRRADAVNTIAKATDILVRAGNATRPPEPTTAMRMQTLGERLSLKAQMRDNQAAMALTPEGSEERALRREFDSLLAAKENDLATAGQPVPGQFSHRDVDHAIKEAELDSAQGATLKLAAHRLGLAPMETVQLGWAIRDARSEARYLSVDEREGLWDQWWSSDGPERVRNAAAFARVWNDKLSPGEREMLRPLLASRRFTETVINLGAQLGTRR